MVAGGIHRLPHPVKRFHRRDERHRHLSLGIAQDAQAQPGRYGQAVHIHFAFGIRTSGADTAVTPVEVTFPGFAHGFQLSAGASLVSNWATVPAAVTTGDALVMVMDLSSSNAAYRYVSPGGDGSYFKLTTNSYADANVSGFTSDPATSTHVTLIEGRNPS